MDCNRLYYDGKLPPNTRDPFKVYAQLKSMDAAKRKKELERLARIRDSQLADEGLLDRVQEDLGFHEIDDGVEFTHTAEDFDFVEAEEEAKVEEKDEEEEEIFITPKKTSNTRGRKKPNAELPPVIDLLLKSFWFNSICLFVQ